MESIPMEDKEQRIFLSTPYTHEKEEVQEERVLISQGWFAFLLREHPGVLVYNPLNVHWIAKDYNLPKTFDFWLPLDRSFLDWANTVHVLCLKDWEYSMGVREEVTYATAKQKVIKFIPEKELLRVYKEGKRNRTA